MKRLALLVPLALSLGSCGEPAKPEINIHESMAGVMAPQAQILWDTSNKGFDPEGLPDPKLLSAADWTTIEAAAAKLVATSKELASGGKLIASAPGIKIDGDGEAPDAPTAATVQSHLDADPANFANEARKFGALAEKIRAAAKAHDAKTVLDTAGDMEEVCEDCHKRYWYPPTPGAPK